MPNQKSIIIDESVVDAEFANMLKEMSNGYGTWVNQKNVKATFVESIPIAIMSNKMELFGENPMADNSEWSFRMYYYKLKPCPTFLWLEDMREKALNPLMWYWLFWLYDLIPDIYQAVSEQKSQEREDEYQNRLEQMYEGM